MTKNTVTTPAGELKQSEVEGAKKEGVLDYIKAGAGAAMAADTGTTGDVGAMGEAASKRVAVDINSTFIAPLLDLSVEELTARLKPKADNAIDFETAKGLLALERAALNRTDYVKALMAAIGVKSPYEVTSAGPAYTNDVSAITVL